LPRSTGVRVGLILDCRRPVRRANRERLYAAKLAGLRHRIIGERRQTEATADELLLECGREASTRGLDRREPAYWDDAAGWIEERTRY
jgi:hypothetical protein